MSQIAFDTLKFAKTLKQAGVPEVQAKAQAEAFAEIFTVNLEKLVIKDDLNLVAERLDKKIDLVAERSDQKIAQLRTEINGKLTLLHWMIGFALAGIVAILLRLFLVKGM